MLRNEGKLPDLITNGPGTEVNRLGGKDDNMKNKYFKCSFRVPMNLQLFAEGGDGAGAEGSNGVGSGGEVQEPMSFDDFLKGEGNQAEFDRRVQKAVNTAVNKAQQKWKIMTDDQVSEAEKLAAMTKEEKAEYLRQKQEKDLAAREANITKRELMAEAKNTLAEKNLPVGLADVLNYTDADSCSRSIAAVEKAFQEAVQAAVEEKLKGGKPPKKAPDGETVTKEQFSKMGYTEKLKLKNENPNLFKQLSGK